MNSKFNADIKIHEINKYNKNGLNININLL